MPEPKKPLITRERYRQYKRDQTKPLVTDEKKHTPATEKNNKQSTIILTGTVSTLGKSKCPKYTR